MATSPLPAMSPSKTPLSFSDVFWFASRYWRRQPWMLAAVLALLVMAALAETYLPTALADFLGAVRQQQSHSAILSCLFIFLGTYLAQAVLFSITYPLYNVFETKLFKALVDDVFAYVYRLPEKFFANTFTGSIISKINRARNKIEAFEDQILLRTFPAIIVLIGTTTFLGLHFPLLAILLVVYVGILSTASISFVFKISGPAQGQYAEAQDAFSAHLADNIGGISTTKAYAQEKDELSRFFEITRLLRIKNCRAYILSNMAGLLQRVLLAGMLAILLGGGTWYLFQGKANVEEIAYLAFAYTILQGYIRELGDNIKNILTASYDLHAVIELIREVPEEESLSEGSVLDIRHGAIAFENVGFTYPGKIEPVFKDFSVSVRAGERIALVGHSGSGKTSFIRLLQLLYPVQEGRILIDGQDIAQGSRFSLRSSIALVPQDPILFHRSLRENIAYGKPDAGLEEIRVAARQAHIDEFIMTLPRQYETLVGERGIKLSGGERQRVAIARAILADRPILILDEATSSLDSASERAIQDALRVLTHGRTSIMIAHRLSTILDADRILVFDQGRIVEEGTHDQLVLKGDGIYAGLFKLQSGGFLIE